MREGNHKDSRSYLGATQLKFLYYLYTHPDWCTAKEIAESCNLGKTGVYMCVTRLKEKYGNKIVESNQYGPCGYKLPDSVRQLVGEVLNGRG